MNEESFNNLIKTIRSWNDIDKLRLKVLQKAFEEDIDKKEE